MLHLWLRLEDGREEVAVAVLILAPVFKVLEQRVQLVVWVPLQVPVDADVPPVTDLQQRELVRQLMWKTYKSL
jgi:hypothetical protein